MKRFKLGVCFQAQKTCRLGFTWFHMVSPNLSQPQPAPIPWFPSYLVGGIPTPLKNMTSSVGMIIPNIHLKKCSKAPTSWANTVWAIGFSGSWVVIIPKIFWIAVPYRRINQKWFWTRLRRFSHQDSHLQQGFWTSFITSITISGT